MSKGTHARRKVSHSTGGRDGRKKELNWGIRKGKYKSPDGILTLLMRVRYNHHSV